MWTCEHNFIILELNYCAHFPEIVIILPIWNIYFPDFRGYHCCHFLLLTWSLVSLNLLTVLVSVRLYVGVFLLVVALVSAFFVSIGPLFWLVLVLLRFCPLLWLALGGLRFLFVFWCLLIGRWLLFCFLLWDYDRLGIAPIVSSLIPVQAGLVLVLYFLFFLRAIYSDMESCASVWA